MKQGLRAALPWLLLAVGVAVTVAVYWPGRTGGWVFDDFPNIVDNAAIHIQPGHATLVAWLNAALSSPASFLHRPLASITFALNWMEGGGNPYPFKLTNIAIHLVNGVLVFVMLRALLRLVLARKYGFAPLARRERGRGEGSGRRDKQAAREVVDASNPEPSPAPSARALAKGEAGHMPPPLRGDALRSAGGDLRPPTQYAARFPPSAGRGTEGDGFSSTEASPRVARASLRTEGESAAATRLALVVAVGWMLLPINLMAVLYVVQRMESLCQVFVLAGLWAYLHGRWMMLTAHGDAARDRRGFALAVGGIVFGTLIGLSSKETAVLLPVFAFLAEWVVMQFARSPAIQSWIPGSIADGAGNGPGMTMEPLSLRERGRSEGSEPRAEPISASDSRPSLAPAGHPLPEGKGNGDQAPDPVRSEDGDQRSPTGYAAAGDGAALLPPSAESVAEGDAAAPAMDKRIWSLFVITLFIPAVLGFLWLLRGALRPSAFASRDFTLGQRLITEPRVLVDYLQWILFPNPDVLSLYHDEIVKSTGLLSPWTTLASMVLLAALLAIAILVRKRRPLIAVGILWFFGSQLLTATIVPLELVFEQRVYFGSIGILMVAADLLLGLRWKIFSRLVPGRTSGKAVLRFATGVARVLIVAVALLWFAVATNLRAQEWSNPIRLAVAEAHRHPTSPRAVYEAGRLLLIASNYQPGKVLDSSADFLKQASAIPGSSTLPDQALIMIADHDHHGDDAAYWQSMIHKLRDQPTQQEDISALIALTNCYGANICRFDPEELKRAYLAALSRPHPIARLNGAYADFQRDILHDDMQAEIYLARAVAGAPSEPAYRVDLAALYARNGQTRKALEQIDALRRMNLLGRLDGQIAVLERMAEQGKAPLPSKSAPADDSQRR